MPHRNFQLLTAPGLPSWPKLYVDFKLKRACVVAKHPTWRSYQCAMRLTAIFTFVGCAVVVYCSWHFWSGAENVFRVFLTLTSCLLLFPIVKFLSVHEGTGFLARQVFPTNTTVWVSSTAFAFRSRLLLRPVSVWRRWKGQTVRLSFILNRDNDAAQAAYSLKPHQKALLQAQLNEAMVLVLVISASNSQNRVTSNEQLLRRTIPLTEVSGRNARKFTTVLAAAVAITSTVSESKASRGGIDVDG